MLSNVLTNLLFDELKALILREAKTVLQSGGTEVNAAELTLEVPPEMAMGDFAFPCFRLAKALRKAPPMISKELTEKFAAHTPITDKFDVIQAGPYVNFKVKKNVLTGAVLDSLLLSKDQLAEIKSATPKNVVIEFSSPNIAKPFNIYHLRSTMIGNSLYRIYRARGFNPIGINHLGDWGTQFGYLSLAFEKYGVDQELESRGIDYLVELYVKINKEAETDATVKDKARENFSKLEKGDAKIKGLWQRFVDLSLREYEKTYKRLNVTFDHFWGESFYIPMVAKLEKELADKKLLVESEGAQVVMLEKFNMPPTIIQKADGSSIYATRDLAAALYRHEKFKFEKMIYVVGREQALHFQQIFKTLELMGYDWPKTCSHVDFGLYRFADGAGGFSKMSTRKGKFITLEAVLDEAVNEVRAMIEKKNAETEGYKMTPAEIESNAEAIGAGAIIFNDLSTDRNGDVNFDLDQVLDFNGETGPYIQYAHTRCLSILRNAPNNLAANLEALSMAAKTHLNEVEETDLIRTLAKLPSILDQVLETSKPNLLANYLIDITKSFNVFYRAHKVLTEDVELTNARLALVLATQRVMNKGLTLLGMRVPERM